MTIEQLADLLIQLMQADTWAVSKQMVLENPVLLSDEVQQVLGMLAESNKENSGVAGMIADHQQLLAYCRTEGVEAAFAQRMQPPVFPDLLQRLQAVSSEAELEALVQKHPELLPVLQQIMSVRQPQAKGGLQQILQTLNQPATLGQMPERILLCHQALSMLSEQVAPELWAALQTKLADSYMQSPQGNRSENIEQAISHYQNTLHIYTQKMFPQDWAMIQNNLGNAYAQRIKGVQSQNLEIAISYYQTALQVYTLEMFPEGWARVQNNLANIYAQRIKGGLTENLERSIEYYQRALEVHTREAFPRDWARVQNNLALVYSVRNKGDMAENRDKVIIHSQRALEVHTREALPEWWAITQNNLGLAYSERIKGVRAENMEQAIEHFKNALEVHTYEAFPQDWAKAQNNLGLAYSRRIKGERAENLERAIEHSKNALEVYTREIFPQDWANVQHNLNLAYYERIKGERAENLERAIEHSENALEINTREVFPQDWAMAQNSLANAYATRMRGKSAENLERAIEHSKNALEVYTREMFPERWAGTHHNLASNYSERIKGERAENLERAIEHSKNALKVYTRGVFPEWWASIQHNLGVIYKIMYLKGGKERNNIEQAIKHYQNALEIYTHEALPSDHRKTQKAVGYLHWQTQQWAKAQVALQSAIDAGKDLFASAYTETGRQAELVETANLYAQSVYSLTQLGEYAHAFTQLEQGKTRLLSEALSLSEANLGHLSSDEKETLFRHRDAVRALEAELRLPSDVPSRRPYQTLTDELRIKRKTLNQFVTQLRMRYPEFMPQALPLDEILSLVPDGGVLVAPFITDKGGGVFIVPHGARAITSEHYLPLPQLTIETLDSLLIGTDKEPGWLRYYTNSQSNQGREDWFNAIPAFTQELWSQIVAPIHAHLAQCQLAKGAPLIILPQGRLGLLPLHAAWREVDGQPRAWLDEYTIQYASSGYALRTSQRRVMAYHDKTPSLLGLINPTEDLPTTPFEGQLVSELFDPSAREMVSGGDVTAERLTKQAPHYQYLHFSGHGFYNWDDVMQSGLTLAKGEQFTLTDILTQLNLRQTRLVTLSACETGMTDIRQTPDEFIGLPTALMQAGAGGVVSTLWAVADFATTLLMTEFYRAHLQEQMPLPVALRHAQQWTRDLTNAEVADYAEGYYKQDKNNPLLFKIYRQAQYRLNKEGAEACPFSNPFYWAAFTYYGA